MRFLQRFPNQFFHEGPNFQLCALFFECRERRGDGSTKSGERRAASGERRTEVGACNSCEIKMLPAESEVRLCVTQRDIFNGRVFLLFLVFLLFSSIFIPYIPFLLLAGVVGGANAALFALSLRLAGPMRERERRTPERASQQERGSIRNKEQKNGA